MKVLTILSKLEMGGIEKTLLSCIPYLKENGVEMFILCSLGGALDEDYKKLGVKLIDFGKHKKPFKDAKFLKKILKEQKFDIVHSRYGHTSGEFAKICKELGIPFLISIHNERAMFRNSWIEKPILKNLRAWYLNYHKNLSVKFATKIIGHSKANLKYFTTDTVYDGKEGLYEVLYNGVDFSKFENYPQLNLQKEEELTKFLKYKEKVLVHIGSFKEQKNHIFLIDVFKKLNPKENSYALILLGVGSLMDQVKNHVKFLDIQDNILFVGMETNIAPYLYASDLFVFPSLYEGFGNVLIEAQYANLPIAASDIAPHYEASFEAYHEYFYDPNNLEQAKDNLEKLLLEENTELIRQARIFSEAFSIQKMANNLFDIFNKSINGK